MQQENDIQIGQKQLINATHQPHEAFQHLFEVPSLLKNQYLRLHSAQKHLTLCQKPPQSEIQAPASEFPHPKIEEFDNSTKESKKSSDFHNFQKHLITTLKANINLDKLKKGDCSKETLTLALWKYFVNSNKPTKRFLYCLLCSNPFRMSELEKKSQVDQQFLRYSTLIKQSKDLEIEEAQVFLRYQIVRQARKLLEKGLLKGRRMRKAQEFEEYFRNFITEVETGDLSLRLPKRKKKDLVTFEGQAQQTCKST